MLLRLDTRMAAIGLRPVCPFCQRPVHGVTFALGLVWLRCEYKHCPARPRATFRTIALPPGLRGAALEELLGETPAFELARRLLPQVATIDASGCAFSFATLELIPPGPVRYLTIASTGPDVHRAPCASEVRAVVRVTTAPIVSAPDARRLPRGTTEIPAP